MKQNDKLVNFMSEADIQDHGKHGWIINDSQLTTVFLKNGQTILLAIDAFEFNCGLKDALKNNEYLDMSTFQCVKRCMTPFEGNDNDVYAVYDLHYELDGECAITYLDPHEILKIEDSDAVLERLVADRSNSLHRGLNE